MRNVGEKRDYWDGSKTIVECVFILTAVLLNFNITSLLPSLKSPASDVCSIISCHGFAGGFRFLRNDVLIMF